MTRIIARSLLLLDPRSNYHEGSLNSTSRLPYLFGADSAEEIVDAARARRARMM
jgi:hypothetical protein